MRDEADHVLEAIDEALGIGRAAGVPVHISHHKVGGERNWGRSEETLAKIMDARASMDVTMDVYPYTAGSTVLRYVLPPDILAGGIEAMLLRLSDPDVRGRLRTLSTDISWSNTFIASSAGGTYDGACVQQLADESGRDPWDVVADILLAADGNATMVRHGMAEADVWAILAQPFAMIGSDGLPLPGKPHPRLCGTFVRVLGHYARDEKLFTLEEAVRKMTSLPADRFNIADRGRLRIGAMADVVVLDPDSVLDAATYDDPMARPIGIDRVFVAGREVIAANVDRGARPGRVLVPG
jgi:N-acyl-D-aspartate/D-glutamate deacylase